MPCANCVVIGDGPLADEVNARLHDIAEFRVPRFKAIYAVYQKDKNAITPDDACFVMRCAADILDRLG
jgi:hypothetical protein